MSLREKRLKKGRSWSSSSRQEHPLLIAGQFRRGSPGCGLRIEDFAASGLTATEDRRLREDPIKGGSRRQSFHTHPQSSLNRRS